MFILDGNPWGMPYKIVQSRLRAAGLSFTEIIEIAKVLDTVESLFPRRETDLSEVCGRIPWRPEYEVSADKLKAAVTKIAG